MRRLPNRVVSRQNEKFLSGQRRFLIERRCQNDGTPSSAAFLNTFWFLACRSCRDKHAAVYPHGSRSAGPISTRKFHQDASRRGSQVLRRIAPVDRERQDILTPSYSHGPMYRLFRFPRREQQQSRIPSHVTFGNSHIEHVFHIPPQMIDSRDRKSALCLWVKQVLELLTPKG
jgi:hypothetical protein